MGSIEEEIEKISLLDAKTASEEFSRFELDLDRRLHLAEFEATNEELHAAELDRVTKVFAFERIHLRERVQRNEQLIAEWELVGTEDERKTNPGPAGSNQGRRGANPPP